MPEAYGQTGFPEPPPGYDGPLGPAIAYHPQPWGTPGPPSPHATTPPAPAASPRWGDMPMPLPTAPGPAPHQQIPWGPDSWDETDGASPFGPWAGDAWGGWSAPVGPTPDRSQRFVGRAIDAGIELALALLVMAAFGDSHRPFTTLALCWFVFMIYETVSVMVWGATPGKQVAGLRVVTINDRGAVPPAAALRRGATSAALASIPVVGWAVWLSSTLTDALTRNVADRAADTIVVRKDAELPILERNLPGYADFVRPPRVLPLGRIADLDVRVRARMRRLNNAPLLAWLLGAIALALSLPFATGIIIIAGTAVWIVAFVIDETIRISRDGATAGHRLAGLVVVNAEGQPPSKGRSFLRALVFALSAYTGIGFIALGASALMIRLSSNGRSLHDLAGGTWVVADPRIDPERQRQLAMHVRLGEVS